MRLAPPYNIVNNTNSAKFQEVSGLKFEWIIQNTL